MRGPSRRRAATLVELTVAFALATLVLSVGYGVFHLLTQQEKGVNRRSQRALQQAQMMESLFRDLRSASGIGPDGSGGYLITRYREVSGRLEERDVTWRRVDPVRIVREETGWPTQTFDFTGTLDADNLALEFRIDYVEDVIFQP